MQLATVWEGAAIKAQSALTTAPYKEKEKKKTRNITSGGNNFVDFPELTKFRAV